MEKLRRVCLFYSSRNCFSLYGKFLSRLYLCFCALLLKGVKVNLLPLKTSSFCDSLVTEIYVTFITQHFPTVNRSKISHFRAPSNPFFQLKIHWNFLKDLMTSWITRENPLMQFSERLEPIKKELKVWRGRK